MYKGVDISKLFFLICVVLIHTKVYSLLPPTEAYYLNKCILRLSVPYFLVVSGYLFIYTLRRSKNSLKEKTQKQILRLWKPFVVFSIINTLLQPGILLYTHDHFPWIKVLKHILFCPYGALWYVYATMLGLVLLYPFIKYKKLGYALILGTLLYGFALLCNNYYFVANHLHIENIINIYLKIFLTARNGLFIGFLFMGIGAILAEMDATKWLSGKMTVGLALISFIIYVLEIYYLRPHLSIDDGGYFISSPFVSACLVLLTLQISIPISDKLSLLFRNLSVGMFFLHRPICTILEIGTFLLFGTEHRNMAGWIFVLTMFMTCSVWFTVYKLKKEPFYSLLK